MMKHLKKIVILLLLAISFILIGIGVRDLTMLNRGTKNIQNIKTQVITEPAKNNDPLYREIDYGALKNRNEHFYGWVYIPDTPIDFYVMEEPEMFEYYYSKRDIDKNWTSSGSIFKPAPDKLIDDPREIYLGHAIIGKGSDGMFTQVNHFTKKDFFDKHEFVYTYKNGKATKWKIWSAIRTDKDDPMYLYSMQRGSDEYKDLLNYLDQNAFFKRDNRPTIQDDILVLSTCDWSEVAHDGRAYVVATKVEEYNQYTRN